jgi:hypothetical protein
MRVLINSVSNRAVPFSSNVGIVPHESLLRGDDDGHSENNIVTHYCVLIFVINVIVYEISLLNFYSRNIATFILFLLFNH